METTSLRLVPKTLLYRILTKHLPILPVVARMQRHAVQELNSLTYLAMLLYAMQLLGFVVNPHFAWGTLVNTGLDQLFFATHMPVYDATFAGSTTATTLHVFLWIAVASLFAILLMTTVGGDRTSADDTLSASTTNSETGATPTTKVSALESALLLSSLVIMRSVASWLLVPMAHWVCAGFACHQGVVADTLGYTGSRPTVCYSGAHVSWIVGGIVLIIAAAPIVIALTTSDADTNALSVHLKARAHTHIDVLMLLQLLLLTALFHVATAFEAMAVAAGALAIVCSAVAFAVSYTLPYYHHGTNRFFAAANTAAATAGAIGFFAALFTSSAARLPTTLLLAVVPAAFLFGWVMPDTRLSSRWQQILQACDDSLELDDDTYDLRAADDLLRVDSGRCLPTMSIAGLDDCVPWQRTASSLSVAAVTSQLLKDNEGDAYADAIDVEQHSDSASGSSGSRSNKEVDPDTARLRLHEIQKLVSRSAARIRSCQASPFVCTVNVETDVELAARFVTSYRRRFRLPAPETLRAACADVYNRGIARFTQNALVRIHYAAHVAVHDSGRSRGALTLLEAVPHMNPTLFESGRFFDLQTQLRSALGIWDHAYERDMAKVTKLHTEALRRMHAFWLKLMEPSVDLASAAELADELHDSRREALTRFANALEAQRGNVNAEYARRLGKFMTEVMLDLGAAAECDAVAVELEKRGSKRSRNTVDAEMATRVARLQAVIGEDDSTTAGASSDRATARRTHLLEQMTAVFALLILCLAALLGVSVLSGSVDHAATNRAAAANRLRTLPLQALHVTSQLQAALEQGLEPVDLSARLRQLASDLEDAMATFVQEDNSVARYLVGGTRSKLSTPRLMAPDLTAVRYDALSFWSVLAMSLAELRSVAVLANATGTTAGLEVTLRHLHEHLVSTSAEAISRDLTRLLEERTQATDVATTIYTVIVGIALAVTLLAVVVFLHNFGRTAETKFLTFQLFTLIPFDSLELLSTATKARIDERESTRARAILAAMENAAGASDDPSDSSGDVDQLLGAADSEDLTAAAAAPASAVPPETPLVESRRESGQSNTSSRRDSGNRRGSSKHNIRTWRTMLGQSLSRQGPPQSILKLKDAKRRPAHGLRVSLNNDIEVIEAEGVPADGNSAMAMSGKHAASVLNAMQRSSSKAAPELAAIAFSFAEKSGELDVETIRADEAWRRSNEVHPTKVLGAKAGSQRRDGDEDDHEHQHPLAQRVLAAANLACRASTVTLTIMSVVAFGIGFPPLTRHAQAVNDVALVQSAALATSRTLQTLHTRAATFVFAPSPAEASFEEYFEYRQTLCGLALIAEPLMNVTRTWDETAALRDFIEASTASVAARSDAVRIAEYGYERSAVQLTVSHDMRLESLTDLTTLLRRHISRSARVQELLDAIALWDQVNVTTSAPAGTGTGTGSVGDAVLDPLLSAAIVATAQDLLSSDAFLGLQTRALQALGRVVSLILRGRCNDAYDTIADGAAFDVARWSALAALLVFAPLMVMHWVESNSISLSRGAVFISLLGLTITTIMAGNEAHVAVDRIGLQCEAGTAVTQIDQLNNLLLNAARTVTEQGSRAATLAFMDAADAHIMGAVADVVTRLTHETSPFLAHQLADTLRIAAAAGRKTVGLHRIAVTLALVARRDSAIVTFDVPAFGLRFSDVQFPLFPEAQTFIDQASWNAASDEGALYDIAVFYGGDALSTYTNKTYDFARWTPTQMRLASVALVHDRRYVSYMAAAAEASALLHTLVVDAALLVATGTSQRLVSVAMVAIAFAVVSTLAVAVFVLPGLLQRISSRLVGGAKAGKDAKESSAMERIRSAPAFQRALRRTYVAVALITLLLSGSLAAGLYAARVNDRVPQYMEAAGLRSLLVAQSYAQLLRPAVYSDHVAGKRCALKSAEALTALAPDLWLNYGRQGSLAALRIDRSFDELNWGPSNPDAYINEAGAYETTQCGVTSSPNTQTPYGPFGILTDTPIVASLHLWQALLDEYMSTRSADRRAAIAALLPDLAWRIAQSALTADDELAKVAERRSSGATVALQALCAVTIALVLLIYQALVVPVSRDLTRVQEDTLLMLQVVPAEVRDLVPAITEFLETGTMDTAAEIRRKLEMNENLLKNILPENISRRLKGGETPIADMHPCITILFTDFVGFTSISSGLSAEEIVDFLNEVFVEFDLITELLQLDKIKTIGDAYFMTGGLDSTVTDHAMRVLEASICMFDALSAHNGRHRDRKPLRMRLGVHTGAAVAGVIGTKKVAYDLWGPNVSIANAMESTGIPGRIHVSETTVSHVRGYYAFEPRGELPREKGVPDAMPATFLLKGRLVPNPYQFLRRTRNDPRQQHQLHIKRAAAVTTKGTRDRGSVDSTDTTAAAEPEE
jgi:class 3 adenylate cyclase